MTAMDELPALQTTLLTAIAAAGDEAALEALRIAMLKYGMPDLRAFFDADQRWIDHYGFRPLDLPSLVAGLSG